MGNRVTFQYTYTVCIDQISTINISTFLTLLYDWRLGSLLFFIFSKNIIGGGSGKMAE